MDESMPIWFHWWICLEQMFCFLKAYRNEAHIFLWFVWLFWFGDGGLEGLAKRVRRGWLWSFFILLFMLCCFRFQDWYIESIGCFEMLWIFAVMFIKNNYIGWPTFPRMQSMNILLIIIWGQLILFLERLKIDNNTWFMKEPDCQWKVKCNKGLNAGETEMTIFQHIKYFK